MFHLVTISGRVLGHYGSEEEAKNLLSPSYAERVKLLNADEYEEFLTNRDPVEAIKQLGVAVN